MSILEASIDCSQISKQLKKRLQSLDRRRYTRCGKCGKLTEREPEDFDHQLCECKGVTDGL